MKKSAYFVVLATAAVAISLLSSFAVSHVDMFRLSKATNAYTINAFDFAKLNPSTNVVLSTNNNNSINMTTSGLSVSGNKLILAPGGYLEVARDDELPFKNAINGLTSIETDMVGRIEYSYLDQLYIVDDALAGPFSFPADVKPSFFKLYNDDENPVEISSLLINYSCEETTSSVIAGHGSYTINNGEFTSTATQTTLTIPQELRSGIISYKVRIPSDSTSVFGGLVVGLSYQDEDWWEKTDTNTPTYIYSAISGAGRGAVASVSSDGWAWSDGTVSRHVVQNFNLQEYNTFSFQFDCDQKSYTIFNGNQITASSTTSKNITGNKIGIRAGGVVGISIKDIKIYKNIDFQREKTNRFNSGTNGCFIIHKENGRNVYESTTNDSYLIFHEKLPNTGTIEWDHTADGYCTNYSEGILFSSSVTANSTATGNNKIAVIGSGKTNTHFSMYGRCLKTTDSTYYEQWMPNRQKINYLSDGTTLHLKVEYDLVNVTFALYHRENANAEWVYHYTFSSNEPYDYSGMSYFGIKSGKAHADTGGVFDLKIENLKVNGVYW